MLRLKPAHLAKQLQVSYVLALANLPTWIFELVYQLSDIDSMLTSEIALSNSQLTDL